MNGDGQGGNDLIFIPENESQINLEAYTDGSGATVTAAQQWSALDRFIEQDDYLSENRGKIAERFGAVNPWFSNIDLRVIQDFVVARGDKQHAFELNVDLLNVANFLNSDWGVRKVASPAATSPLRLVRFENGEPVFNFTGPSETWVDDLSELSRWRIQLGLRYLFN